MIYELRYTANQYENIHALYNLIIYLSIIHSAWNSIYNHNMNVTLALLFSGSEVNLIGKGRGEGGDYIYIKKES